MFVVHGMNFCEFHCIDLISVVFFSFMFDFFFICRLPIVSDCPAGQTDRIASNLHSPSSSSTMAVTRVPSPPLPEVNTPVAENWCYTQASIFLSRTHLNTLWKIPEIFPNTPQFCFHLCTLHSSSSSLDSMYWWIWSK